MSHRTASGRLRLTDITEMDIPGVTPEQAKHHVQACLVCLAHHMHETGVQITLRDEIEETACLDWEGTINDHMRRSWHDMQETTEYAAAAIGILIVLECTEYTVAGRAVKGDGFDYWLVETEAFDPESIEEEWSARLEVSGILYAEKDGEIRSRVREKKAQTNVSDHLGLPAIIVVVEFSRPEAHMARKNAQHTKSA